MNNATDYGFNTDWTIKVHSGLECSCLAEESMVIQKYRVTNGIALKGFWKVILIDGPEAGQTFDLSEHRILADAYHK